MSSVSGRKWQQWINSFLQSGSPPFLMAKCQHLKLASRMHKMRIFKCNFAKFSRGHGPGPPKMVVPLALPLKLICDVTRLWRNLAPLGNFLRTPLFFPILFPCRESVDHWCRKWGFACTFKRCDLSKIREKISRISGTEVLTYFNNINEIIVFCYWTYKWKFLV